ncbi:MAG: alpha/beta fold hydrolase [Gammaproteobacteria bacterium]|nr:alpha/beta fold hydrolase [Gammaproteobacteria bacterium]
MKHSQSSSYLDLGHYKLHLRNLVPLKPSQAPVLMLHGAIENGRIFYSHSGKGFGCFLADQGFPTYCADFAGRGLSQPRVKDGLAHSQNQLICADIPALINELYELHQQPLHIVCHSWGGVVLVASLLRFAELRSKVQSLVCFGTKRQITGQSLQRKLQIDLVWNRLAPWLCRKFGHLPAKKLRLGADDEPTQYLLDTIAWIKPSAFCDVSDGFNYEAAASDLAHWPRSKFIAAVNDKVLGHAVDVQHFMREAGLAAAEFSLLAKANGNAEDYDHISMLTHPAATKDHFPELAKWLQQA